MDDLRGVRRPSLPATPDIIARQPSTKPESDQLREAGFWFQSWVQIYHRSPNPEKSFVGFITQVLKSGVLNIDEASQLFFRVCAETSVNHYAKAVAVGNYASAYSYVDAMSKLVVFIIKYHGDASGFNNDQAKVHYFTKILSIVVLVLASYHEDNEAMVFEQKPQDEAGDKHEYCANSAVVLRTRQRKFNHMGSAEKTSSRAQSSIGTEGLRM